MLNFQMSKTGEKTNNRLLFQEQTCVNHVTLNEPLSDLSVFCPRNAARRASSDRHQGKKNKSSAPPPPIFQFASDARFCFSFPRGTYI